MNIERKTDATSVRLQQALVLYHVQLINDDSGCEKRAGAFKIQKETILIQ